MRKLPFSHTRKQGRARCHGVPEKKDETSEEHHEQIRELEITGFDFLEISAAYRLRARTGVILPDPGTEDEVTGLEE